MIFNSFKSGSVLVSGLGVALAGTLGSSAMGEFYRNVVRGEWYEPDTSTMIGSFEEEAFWNQKEYSFAEDDGSGFSIDVRQRSVLFEFTGTEDSPGYWNEADFNGWVFSDVNGTIAGFDYLTVRGKGPKILWENVEYGVTNEDEFWVNFGSLGEDQLLTNGDSFRLVMHFVPAPACAVALLGFGFVRRRRS